MLRSYSYGLEVNADFSFSFSMHRKHPFQFTVHNIYVVSVHFPAESCVLFRVDFYYRRTSTRARSGNANRLSCCQLKKKEQKMMVQSSHPFQQAEERTPLFKVPFPVLIDNPLPLHRKRFLLFISFPLADSSKQCLLGDLPTPSWLQSVSSHRCPQGTSLYFKMYYNKDHREWWPFK